MLNEIMKSKMKYIADNCLATSGKKSSCKLCMKECPMMYRYTESPKELFSEYLEKGYANMDPKIAFSCNLCDQCKLVCPKKLDLKSSFQDLRNEYSKDNGGKSPLKGHKGVQVHQYLGETKLFSKDIDLQKENIKYLFFPGCSLSSYSPSGVKSILNHLNDKLENNVESMLACCGKPTRDIGEVELFSRKFQKLEEQFKEKNVEKIVVACQSCYKMFKENLDIETVSLWELLPEIGLPEDKINIGIGSDLKFNIHDSCPTRFEKSIQDGVRWIVDELGYQYEEFEYSKEKTRCCGLGGMVASVASEISEEVRKKRAESSSTGNILTYCAGCREALEVGETKTLHIVDLIFGEQLSKKDLKKKNSNPLKGWINRYKTKIELKK
ncbi:(Fe-S)-binding protein [Cetobacterium sp.]|uniref:(Fe-S)-binding protein n=2 Tax=Cetobacterium sp. TaxID=2071632 RepID=UPI003F3C535E